MNLTLGVNKHNVAWHVCDQIKVLSGGRHYIAGPYSTRPTGPCECSATARPPSHSPMNRQTYKPDEGVALTNEQRVASIHHDERVRLTGEGKPHEPGMRTHDTIGVGVVQWLSIHLHIKPLTDYFAHLMYRQYINESSVWGGGCPQFLFAEPSYIGMHLFGVLLPLMWLMRGRDRIYAKRLRNLIVVYAIGAVLMQAGTRIVLDSVVALLVAIIVHNSWCDKKQRVRGIAQLLGAVMLGLLGVLADSRLSSIAGNGAEGDGSFFARIYQSLDPICGLFAHPWTVLTGYGSGNIINAVWAGAKHAGRLLNGLGMNGSAAVGFAAGMNADTVWTMCAYTSVVAEYGSVGLVLLVIASIVSVTRVFDTAAAGHGVWSKTVICWLVLIVYLYIQCENYAFAALPLFIFAASKLRK